MGRFKSTLTILIIMVMAHITPCLGEIYEVGPGKAFDQLSKVPFDNLDPGDLVKIYHRQKPYPERVIIRRSGTKKAPIIIRGIPSKGRLPVIDGAMARQFQKENWPNSGRWLIKLGDGSPADHVRIENLIIRNAHNMNSTIEGSNSRFYTKNAAGIFLRSGKHVVISNCRIHSCGNGILTYYAPEVTHLKIRKSIIYGNGDRKGSKAGRTHNVYLQGKYTIIEFCRFNSPFSSGQNIKDRGFKTIIRYNWIEGGYSRQLDLVDRKGYKGADAFVYGNVIVQADNPQHGNIVHWGGDLGHSRSGTLYFFNNTVIGKHLHTRYIDVRYPDCSVDVKNNAFVGTGSLWNGVGRLKGMMNWFSSGIEHQAFLGISGIQPGFLRGFVIPYIPFTGSALINTGIIQTPLPVKYMPLPRAGGLKRPKIQAMDIGAYEFAPGLIKQLSKRRSVD